jgi:methyl-accepting chemotaxis protein
MAPPWLQQILINFQQTLDDNAAGIANINTNLENIHTEIQNLRRDMNERLDALQIQLGDQTDHLDQIEDDYNDMAISFAKVSTGTTRLIYVCTINKITTAPQQTRRRRCQKSVPDYYSSKWVQSRHRLSKFC